MPLRVRATDREYQTDTDRRLSGQPVAGHGRTANAPCSR